MRRKHPFRSRLLMEACEPRLLLSAWQQDMLVSGGVSGMAIAPIRDVSGDVRVALGAPLAVTPVQPVPAFTDARFTTVNLATFRDLVHAPGSVAYTASIDWGDGTRSAGGVQATGGGEYSVAGSHAFAGTGAFTITVMVNDGTADSNATLVADVTSPAPEITDRVDLPMANVGQKPWLSQAALGDQVYYVVAGDGGGRELWTAGAAGNVRLATGSAGAAVTDVVTLGDSAERYLVFDGQLYQTDNTAGGTHTADAGFGQAHVLRQAPVVVGGRLIFAADDAGGLGGLYSFDGLTITALGAAPAGFAASTLAPVLSAGRAFAFFYNATSDTYELLSTDGTADNVQDAGAFQLRNNQSAKLPPVAGDGGIYFFADGPLTYEPVLWFSDGTAGGTHIAAESWQIWTGAGDSVKTLNALAYQNGVIVAIDTDDELGPLASAHVSIYDPGAHQIISLTDVTDFGDTPLVAVPGHLYFAGIQPNTAVEQLYDVDTVARSVSPVLSASVSGAVAVVTDGGAVAEVTVDGIGEVWRLGAGAPQLLATDVTLLRAAGGAQAFFQWDDGVHGVQTWATTAGGIQRLSSPAAQTAGTPSPYGVVNGRIFVAIAADDSVSPVLLTANGVATAAPFLRSLIPPLEPALPRVDLAHVTYWVPHDTHRLMRTDGTAAGTFSLGEFGPDGVVAERLAYASGRLYVFYENGSTDQVLWSIAEDGTAANQVPAMNASASVLATRDVHGGLAYSIQIEGTPTPPDFWTDGSVVRTATDDEHPSALPAGPGAFGLAPDAHGQYGLEYTPNGGSMRFLTPFARSANALQYRWEGGLAFVLARYYSDETEELWVSDGTVSGTRLLSNHMSGQQFETQPFSVTVPTFAGTLYFPAQDPVTQAGYLATFDPASLIETPALAAAPAALAIRLSWSSAAGIDGFILERSADGGAHFDQFALLYGNVSEYVDSQVQTDTMYTYRLRAVRNGITGAYSATASATVPHPVAIGAALATTNVVVGDPATLAFTITYAAWTPVTDNIYDNHDVVTVIGPDGQVVPLDLPTQVEWNADGLYYFSRTYHLTAPGGAWDAADVGAYRIVVKANTVENQDHLFLGGGTLGRFYVSPNLYFDEAFYEANNPDVAAAIARGQLASGWAHYQATGGHEGRSPSAVFDEAWYRQMNPDVAAAIGAGALSSGFEHFIQSGRYEGRAPTAFFDAAFYLVKNPDVAAAVIAGQVPSAYDHYLATGAAEGRAASTMFDTSFYLSANPGAAAEIATGKARNAYVQFLTEGLPAGAAPNPFYSERDYLAFNPDVAAAVHAGTVRSGLEHFVLSGEIEGRRASVFFDVRYYVQQNPAIVAEIVGGSFRSVYAEFLAEGLAHKNVATPWFDESYYLAHNADVAAAVQAGTVASGFEHYIEAGAREGRDASPLFHPAAYTADSPDAQWALATGAFLCPLEQFVLTGFTAT